MLGLFSVGQWPLVRDSEHLSRPTSILKISNRGHWLPSIRFGIYKQNKDKNDYTFCTKASLAILHKSGNMVFGSTGYDDRAGEILKKLVKWFSNFKFYTIISQQGCTSNIDNVVEQYENIGVKTFVIPNNLACLGTPILNRLPVKPIVVGNQSSGFSLDILGDLQTYNESFKGYLEPYIKYKQWKKNILENNGNLMDLLLTKDQIIDHEIGYHRRGGRWKKNKFNH